MIAEWLYQRSLLVQELKDQNAALREENKELWERITQMAASVPHIRLARQDEEQEIEATSPLAIYGEEGDEKGLRIGNKGANVV